MKYRFLTRRRNISINLKENKSIFRDFILYFTFVATWAMVFTNLWYSRSAINEMKRQNTLMSNSFRIQNRPILHAVTDTLKPEFEFNFHNELGWNKKINHICIDDVSGIDSIYINVNLNYKLLLSNEGNSALLYGNKLKAIITEEDWENKYKMDPDNIEFSSDEFLRNMNLSESPDNFIFPEGNEVKSYLDVNQRLYLVDQDISKFIGSEMTLYGVIYIPYKDFYENEYSLLIINFSKYILDSNNEIIFYKHIDSGIEKYVDNFNSLLDAND